MGFRVGLAHQYLIICYLIRYLTLKILSLSSSSHFRQNVVIATNSLNLLTYCWMSALTLCKYETGSWNMLL